MLDSSVWDTDPYSWSIVQKSKYVDNPEYIRVTLDASNHILYGVKRNGDTIISGVSILDLKRRIDNNVIEVGYDESTYSIYTITGTESNVNLSMDASGNIYQETIE